MKKTLDELVKSGDILSHHTENLDDEGNVGKSNSRNSERLTIKFPSGNQLVIGTWCSGCAENTGFQVETT
jgi:hypothetical protein